MVHLLIGNNRSVKHLMSQVAMDTNRRVICIDKVLTCIQSYGFYLLSLSINFVLFWYNNLILPKITTSLYWSKVNKYLWGYFHGQADLDEHFTHENLGLAVYT